MPARAPGHASSFQVSDSRPAQVMNQLARAASFGACVLPGFHEESQSLPVAVKYPRVDPPLLQSNCCRALQLTKNESAEGRMLW
jgi:hypothetical protein